MPLFRLKAPQILRWSLLALIPVFWCALAKMETAADRTRAGGLEFLENKFLDWRFHVRGELTPPVKIVYIDVDSISLSDIGNVPWNRAFYADVAAAVLHAGHARAVGIDFIFSQKGVPESIDWKKHVAGNLALLKFLRDDPPVVFAAAYGGREFRDILGNFAERALPVVEDGPGALAKMEPPEVPEFERSFDPAHPEIASPPNIGLIDTYKNGTRVVPAYVPETDLSRGYLHMALELARIYWGLPREAVKFGPDRIYPDRIDFVGEAGKIFARIPLRQHQWLEVNWFQAWSSKRRVHLEFSTTLGYAQNLQSAGSAEHHLAEQFFEQFRDAVVLIGPVDPILQDVATTPLDPLPVPRVGLHGNLLQTIVSGKYLLRLPLWHDWPIWEFAIILIFACTVTGLAVAGGTHGVLEKVFAGLLVGAYVAGALVAFDHFQWVVPMAGPLGAAFSMTFAAVGWQLIDEEKQKRRIKNMFGTYVSPELVDIMVASRTDPQLGGHDQEITSYFSDIQAFSTFSEKLKSGPLVELMNEYLTACTDILQSERGTLDKYIGDAVVAMFGSPVPYPDHALHACRTAQRVQEKMVELRAKWKNEGTKWPEIVSRMRTRIGLNSGLATVGNMGSPARFDYTMMGDNVNLAARMESGGKAYGVYIMVAEATKNDCVAQPTNDLVFRALDRIVVKGRSAPVTVFELVGRKNQLDARTLECLHWFDAGLARYLAHEWLDALANFEKSAALEIHGREKETDDANPSRVFLARCRQLAAEPPPADWNGVYTMTTK